MENEKHNHEAEKMKCDYHGDQDIAHVCQHLAETLITGKSVGFIQYHDENDEKRLLFEAHCIACESLLNREGEWNETVNNFANIQSVCPFCFRDIKNFNLSKNKDKVSYFSQPLNEGFFTKVIFPRKQFKYNEGGAESMWVLKLAGNEDHGVGLLENDPIDIKWVKTHNLVYYKTPHHSMKPTAIESKKVPKDLIKLRFLKRYQDDKGYHIFVSNELYDYATQFFEESSDKFETETIKLPILTCDKCGKPAEIFLVPKIEWKFYVPKESRKEVICFECYRNYVKEKIISN